MTRRTSGSDVEASYVDALSRARVVSAYAKWSELTVIERICVSLVANNKMTALDLGCGAGRFAIPISSRAERYLGVDASKEMVAAARKRFPSNDFQVADIVEFETDLKWNRVFLMGNVLDCLHPYSRRAAMLTKCRSWLLGTSGVLVGSTHLSHNGADKGYYKEDYHGATIQNYRCTMRELIDELDSLGFLVDLISRDYRNSNLADWCYWIAKPA